MKFTEFFIKRPVFSIVLCLFLIALGIIGYLHLPVREYPKIQRPVVAVWTTFPGASPALMESDITNKVEAAIATVNGIDFMRSFSDSGSGFVVITFKLGTDVDRAANEVRNNIASIQMDLPKEVEMTVFRSDPDSDEMMDLSVIDPSKSILDLTNYLNQFIVPQLQQIDGVSNAEIYGERDYSMRIWLDPNLMASHDISVSDVINKLQSVTQHVPGGQIKTPDRYYSVQTQLGLNTPQEFNQLVLRQANNYLLRISDVGRSEIAAQDLDNDMRIDGKSALAIGIIPDPLANPLAVSNNVRELLKTLQESLPKTMKISVLFDEADYIKSSLHGVYNAVVEAIVLVMLVVVLFLGAWRSSLIPIVTIPICLIATCFFIYLLGFSLNTITLLAFVLAIGLVVDDAIVVLENIYRYIEQGMSPLKAAIVGGREILFAIIAMTLTLAIVYAPIGFASGMTGVLFQQFAFTLAIAVLISGFVAITLSPMMCGYLLRPHKKENFYVKRLETFLNKLEKRYQIFLKWILNKRYFVLLALILIIIATIFLYRSLPQELTPAEDQGNVSFSISPPSNSSFDYTNRYTKMVETILAQTPEVVHYFAFVKPDQVYGRAIFKPIADRKISQEQLMNQFNLELQKLIGVNVSVFAASSLGGDNSRRNGGLTVMILTNQNFNDLYNVMQQLEKTAKQYPGFSTVQQGLVINSQTYNVEINRNLAATLNVDPLDIANTINTLLGGAQAGTFEQNDRTYNVIVQMQQNNTDPLQMINQFNVKSSNDKMIPLASLVTVKALAQPPELVHYNRMRAAILSAQLAPGYSTDQGIDHLKQMLQPFTQTGQYQYAFTGSARELIQSRNTMITLFVLALLFIYFVLAAQFESFIDPLVIMLTVPLAVSGALLTLKLTGKSLNIYSEIGLVTLIGLIAKHGILITEFANQLRAKGIGLTEAIVQGATLRLRPILMTTLAMSMGALPLALASGAGSAARSSIGWVIVGGLICGTLFSLFVVPVAYCVLFGFKSGIKT